MAEDDEPDWLDQRPVVMTAGAAALILVALLVYAVIRTSDSSKVPDTVPIPSSSATPSTYTTSSTSTTSYSVPRVQTSEDNPGAPGPRPVGPHRGVRLRGCVRRAVDHRSLRDDYVVERRPHLTAAALTRQSRWNP